MEKGEDKFPYCLCLGLSSSSQQEREMGLTYWLFHLKHRDIWVFILLLFQSILQPLFMILLEEVAIRAGL